MHIQQCSSEIKSKRKWTSPYPQPRPSLLCDFTTTFTQFTIWANCVVKDVNQCIPTWSMKVAVLNRNLTLRPKDVCSRRQWLHQWLCLGLHGLRRKGLGLKSVHSGNGIHPGAEVHVWRADGMWHILGREENHASPPVTGEPREHPCGDQRCLLRYRQAGRCGSSTPSDICGESESPLMLIHSVTAKACFVDDHCKETLNERWVRQMKGRGWADYFSCGTFYLRGFTSTSFPNKRYKSFYIYHKSTIYNRSTRAGQIATLCASLSTSLSITPRYHWPCSTWAAPAPTGQHSWSARDLPPQGIDFIWFNKQQYEHLIQDGGQQEGDEGAWRDLQMWNEKLP